MAQGDLTESHCNRCGGKRTHHIVYVYDTEWSEQVAKDDPNARVFGDDRYAILQCAGCAMVSFRHTSTFSEVYDDDGRPIPTITFYPPRIFRPIPKWAGGMAIVTNQFLHLLELPKFVTRLLREIYTAVHGDCLSLAAMGVRALLEGIMIEKVGDQGTFGKNLKAFEENGFVGGRQREILEATLEVGHASIHRGFAPSNEDIALVLDITENIVETLYVSEIQATALRKRVPPRAPKQGGGSL